MATVYYLDWDEATTRTDARREFFTQLTFADASDIETIPRDWYREVAEVPDMDSEAIWKAFQGVTSDRPDGEMAAAQDAHRQAADRSMSVGDVIQSGDRAQMAASRGFTDVSWGAEPDMSVLD